MKCPSFKKFPLAIHTKDYVLMMYQNRYVMNIPILQGVNLTKKDIIEMTLQDNTIYITFRKDQEDVKNNILK